MRFPRPTHRVFARRDPARGPRVTGFVLCVFALEGARDAPRGGRARGGIRSRLIPARAAASLSPA